MDVIEMTRKLDRLFRKTRDTRLIWRLVLSMIQMLRYRTK